MITIDNDKKDCKMAVAADKRPDWNTSTAVSVIFERKILFGQKVILNKRIILYATNPKRMLSAYDTPDLPEVLMRDVLGAVKNIKDAHLIIKIHPFDTNLRIYKRLINELGVKWQVTVVR